MKYGLLQHFDHGDVIWYGQRSMEFINNYFMDQLDHEFRMSVMTSEEEIGMLWSEIRTTPYSKKKLKLSVKRFDHSPRHSAEEACVSRECG